jgi:Tfp pilus assembly PilM family ATPase
MAKAPNSVIGIDLGRYSLKSVLIQRRGGDRMALTHYGCHIPDEPATDAESLGKQLKLLLRDMGGSARACVLSVSSPGALIRIIEQPETPPHILRDALRLNGMTLLNQDVKSFVLDCDLIPASQEPMEAGQTSRQLRYLVGGLPRTEVQQIGQAVETAGLAVQRMQLAPVSLFNAFEFAKPEVFNDEAFFLLDIGHVTSTMMVGAHRSLILVRMVEFGGRSLFEALTGLSGEGRESVMEALEQEDEVMVEYTRVAINTLAREIGSSIGFYEARHEQTIHRVFVTGGPARSKTFIKLMGEELGMPCEAWSAAEQCENALSGAQKSAFLEDGVDLNVACGAATEALKAK